jgi:hypothetical protein
MPLFSQHHDLSDLDDRLHDAPAVTADLMSRVAGETCRRFLSTKIERLIRSGAWTDATLALIELELPPWRLRRLVYDQGEWHCALSLERELPEWLDQSIEAHHADLPLAILSAFVRARRSTAPSSRTSVPAVPRSVDALYEPVPCDNFA